MYIHIMDHYLPLRLDRRLKGADALLGLALLALIALGLLSQPCGWVCRGKRLHTRNQHLGNHRGSSVAFSNGFSVAFPTGFHFSVAYSKGLSLVQWI